jgi:hypothetical protein
MRRCFFSHSVTRLWSRREVMPSIKVRPLSKHPLCHEVVNANLPAYEDRHEAAGVLRSASKADSFLVRTQFLKSARCLQLDSRNRNFFHFLDGYRTTLPNARTIPHKQTARRGLICLTEAWSTGRGVFFERVVTLAAAGIRLAMMACKPGEFPKLCPV